MRLPDPAERFQTDEDFPCGCEAQAPDGAIFPCKAHREMNLTNDKLWGLLKQTFPDLELPEPEPPERPWPDTDEEC